MFELSFLLPLKGFGDKYGESVSKTIFSIPILFKNLSILPFLNVTTPPIPIFIPKAIILFACSTESDDRNICWPQEECNAQFWIDNNVSPGVFQDTNGYWNIEHQGFNYFTIKGELSEAPLTEVNGVPIVETIFDSDYWIWIDGITFTVPLYSV